MKLEIAQKILAAALAAARKRNFKPLAVAVLDARGALKALAAEDGTSLKRGRDRDRQGAGALAMGLGSRTLGTMARRAPAFRRRRHPCRRRHADPRCRRRADPRRRGGAARRGRRLRRHLRQRRDGGRGRHRGRGIEGRSRSLSRAMPELPEVETVRAGPRARAARAPFHQRGAAPPDLRFPLPERFAERLTGRTVERLDRRAKYILVHLDKRRGAGRASRHDGPVQRAAAAFSLSPSSFTARGQSEARRGPARRVHLRARPATPSTTTWCSRCRAARSSPTTMRAASAT